MNAMISIFDKYQADIFFPPFDMTRSAIMSLILLEFLPLPLNLNDNCEELT